MSATTKAGTIRKADEVSNPSDVLIEKRFDHGLCVTCSAQLFEITETGGRRKLNPVTTPGRVSTNGRCLYCHPEKESHNPVKQEEEEEENWEDAATVPVEEVETSNDNDGQSLPPVITLDGLNEHFFVGIVSEGNTKKGKGIFQYLYKTGKNIGKSIVYEGEFADGFFEGHGSVRDQGGGFVLEGEWKKSKLHGYCKVTHENGTMYEGELKNDMIDGHGTCTWADGDVYEGNWKDDEYNGQGTYTSVDGDRYEGEFQHGLMNGGGKMVYKNGNIYEGNWKNDKYDGQGTLRYANGRAKVGTWKAGTFVG